MGIPWLEHTLFFAGLASAAVLYALFEIQIEGEHGWAAKLPTWRLRNRWTRLVFGAKPMTGYHLYSLLFVFLMVHLPYVYGQVLPSWSAELRIVSFFILFWTLEDFLWFVLSPAFGLRRFRREHIWWHASAWWWIMPRDYWLGIPLGGALYVLSWTGC